MKLFRIGNRKFIDVLYFYNFKTDAGAKIMSSCRNKNDCLATAFELLKKNDSAEEVSFHKQLLIGKRISINNSSKNIYVYRYEFPELVKSCENCKWKNLMTGECETKLPKKYRGDDEKRPCYDDYSCEYLGWNYRYKDKE